ncbi:MAG TPA: metalloregulator ArsR/SmtB family transcription factor [Candidatus Sulfotelmatobacter sp.]|nr:metalloregulator ArsR/SmtB family transcription factor [Candidatus Sulfotelmatobacter sp.]
MPTGAMRSKSRKRGAVSPAPALLDAMADKAAEATRLLKLLANQNRLLVLCFLMVRGEMTVGALASAVGLSQSALSQHLARLREDRLVTFRRESQTLYYRLVDARAARVLGVLKDIFCGDLA